MKLNKTTLKCYLKSLFIFYHLEQDCSPINTDKNLFRTIILLKYLFFCLLYQSEYLLETDRRREYITGFTGSTGTAVVTEDKAALWIDSRYYIQAKREVDLQIWNLMEHGEEGVR